MRIIIVTAGSFAREIFAWCQSMGAIPDIAGFLDPDPNALDGYGFNLPILGSEDSTEITPDDRFIMGAADPTLKAVLAEKIKSRGGQFISIIHPSVIIASDVQLGEGAVVCPNAVLATNMRVGDFVTINFGAGIGHDTTLGDYSTVNPGAQIGGKCTIGEGVLIGSGSDLLQEISIGRNATVGSGAVVMSSVEEGATMLGNPARRLPV